MVALVRSGQVRRSVLVFFPSSFPCQQAGPNARGLQRFPLREVSPIDTACLLFSNRPIPQDFKKAAASLAAPRQAQQADNEWEQEEDGSPPASKKPRPDQPQSSTSRRGSPTDTRRNGFGSAARIGTQQPLPKFGEVLKLFRVNMRELKKKDDYQVGSLLRRRTLLPPLSESA